MKEHILIIEDEKAIQSVLYELLIEAGYLVILDADGLEGLSQFRKQTFSLVLLDIMMPKIDGYAVCEIIRRTSDIPIIMLTAMDEEEAQVKAFELQADDYITKPFSLKLVLMRIEAVLRRTKAKSENHTTLISHGIKLDTAEHTVKVKWYRNLSYTTGIRHSGSIYEKSQSGFNKRYPDQPGVGYDFTGDEKAVNIHVMNLRRKLSVDCIQNSTRGGI